MGAGHGGSGGLPGGTVHSSASYSEDGSTVNIQIGGNHYSGSGQAHAAKTHGGVIYSSQWQGWVPGDCGQGDLGSSRFAVRNLKITGRVIQGPEPRLCHPVTPAPTPEPTTPSPTPGTLPTPAPTPVPGPASNCPGGSSSACVKMCPADKLLERDVCKGECASRCIGGGKCTGGDDGHDLATCFHNCASGVFGACVSCCAGKFTPEISV